MNFPFLQCSTVQINFEQMTGPSKQQTETKRCKLNRRSIKQMKFRMEIKDFFCVQTMVPD